MLPDTTPPERSTRAISATAGRGAGKQCRPAKLTTRSTAPSANGSDETSGQAEAPPGRRHRASRRRPASSRASPGRCRRQDRYALPRPQATKRHAATARHVEHYRARWQRADLGRRPRTGATGCCPRSRQPRRPSRECSTDRRRRSPTAGRRPRSGRSVSPHPTRSGERSISGGTPNASTRSTAIGRTRRQSRLTSRLIALDRATVQPAVLHEPRPVGLDHRQRVQVAEQDSARLLSPSRATASLSTNASSTSRSTCARAAAITWSWTRENTRPGFMPASTPRLSRRATPASRCSSRNRSIARW